MAASPPSMAWSSAEPLPNTLSRHMRLRSKHIWDYHKKVTLSISTLLGEPIWWNWLRCCQMPSSADAADTWWDWFPAETQMHAPQESVGIVMPLLISTSISVLHAHVHTRLLTSAMLTKARTLLARYACFGNKCPQRMEPSFILDLHTKFLLPVASSRSSHLLRCTNANHSPSHSFRSTRAKSWQVMLRCSNTIPTGMELCLEVAGLYTIFTF